MIAGRRILRYNEKKEIPYDGGVKDTVASGLLLGHGVDPTKTLDQEHAKELFWKTKACKSLGDQRLADAVLSVSVKANGVLFGEVKEDAVMYEVLKELMADEINEKVNAGINTGIGIGEKRGEKQGEKNGLKALADVLQKLGLDFESAYQAIIKTETYQKVSREQVREYWN